jgi:integrase
MSSRYQKGSLQKTKRKNGAVVWTFRWREGADDARIRRKKVVGTVEEFPTRKAAEQAVCQLRSTINAEVVAPQTVNDLIAHYRKHEMDRKAFSTTETEEACLQKYIQPGWGSQRLGDVRTIRVEEWLKGLPLAPSTRSKIKSVFSLLYSHAIRHEWLALNPITKVRTSQKRVREKDVLTPAEFQAILEQLSVRDRAMVLLAASAGLRRSELVALKWNDVDTDGMQIAITKAFVRGRFSECKTESSRKPVPLHPVVLQALLVWRDECSFADDDDFVFASLRMNGNQPLSPDTLCKKQIKPAVARAGITKRVGWHTCRHSLATWLQASGASVKTTQELMRHATAKMTMDTYAKGITELKKEANDKVVFMMLDSRKKTAASSLDPSGPLGKEVRPEKVVV